jgi:hypothetical protein
LGVRLNLSSMLYLSYSAFRFYLIHYRSRSRAKIFIFFLFLFAVRLLVFCCLNKGLLNFRLFKHAVLTADTMSNDLRRS